MRECVTGVSEITFRCGHQVGNRIGGEAAVADVVLDQPSNRIQGHGAHGCIPARRGAKVPCQVVGSGATSVTGSWRTGCTKVSERACRAMALPKRRVEP